MNKTQIAKAVVNNLVGFGVGTVTRTFVQAHIPRHSNPIVNTAIGASIVATSWAVSGTVFEPVRNHTDREIDKIAETISQFKKS